MRGKFFKKNHNIKRKINRETAIMVPSISRSGFILSSAFQEN